MAMKRCPVCGEKYSDTYRTCPFCEEEAYWEDAEDTRRAPPPSRGGKKGHGPSYSLITPTLIVLILIMALLLVYLLYGDKIAAKLGGGEEKDNPGVVDPVEPAPGGQPGGDSQDGGTGTEPGGSTEGPEAQDPANPDAQEPDGSGGAGGTDGGAAGTMPEGSGTSGTPNSGGASASDTSYSVAAKLPKTLTLSKTDFTRSVSEGTVSITASGGSGSYTWISENPSVATVSSSGVVTPVAAGTTNILATDGTKCGICIVRVKGGSAPATSTGTTSTGTSSGSGSGGSNTLNKTDFTQSVAQGPVQLRLSGVTMEVTWSTSNSSVATVSGSGLVTPVGKGQATITASWDGQSRTCIVRVPN